MWDNWMKEPLSARLLEFLPSVSDSADEFLVEFVLVLLEHQKSRQEIATDLEDFLGENAETVSHW
jgi:PWI domain